LRLLKPRHTALSVVENLLAGLDDGTIVIEPTQWGLFPNLARELEIAIETSGQSMPLSPPLLKHLSAHLAPFADVVDGLESLIKLTRELRRSPELSLGQDLGWLLRRIAKRSWRLSEAAREPASKATRLAKMLEIALEEETSIVEELSVGLQISLADVLKALLEQAVSFTVGSLNDFVHALFPDKAVYEIKEKEVYEKRSHLISRLESTLSGRQLQIEDLKTLIQTLHMALIRAEATIPVQPVAKHGRTTTLR